MPAHTVRPHPEFCPRGEGHLLSCSEPPRNLDFLPVCRARVFQSLHKHCSVSKWPLPTLPTELRWPNLQCIYSIHPVDGKYKLPPRPPARSESRSQSIASDQQPMSTDKRSDRKTPAQETTSRRSIRYRKELAAAQS